MPGIDSGYGSEGGKTMKQKVTLSLDGDLLKILRHHIVDKEIQLSEFIEQCLSDYLLNHEKEVLQGVAGATSLMKSFVKKRKPNPR
jgi:hypothetical protein